MAYFKIGSYLFSDDFDRFFELLSQKTQVIYTSSRANGALNLGSASNITMQRFALYRKFRDEKWLFIDPATQYNPETEQIHRIGTVPWGDPLIMDMDVFRRTRELMDEAIKNLAS